jgi:hypothetical protein
MSGLVTGKDAVEMKLSYGDVSLLGPGIKNHLNTSVYISRH